ncbi:MULTISPECIES: hypothetical protein [Stenotrophomonas maltophilia group]|uniref:hypothetical protein n=1 Tax=Stenotrophomonas maltophilia group TaxID=995085 RepID=UPI001F532234|nr:MULTISPECIES: hypothetical protein [Stenotrophomonas maltophilia group]MDW7600190.1 hypothetical protein [Stenotrophomonas maltophilia]
MDVRDRRLGNCGWRQANADHRNAAQPGAECPQLPKSIFQSLEAGKHTACGSPNLRILPIPERALKQGSVFMAQE